MTYDELRKKAIDEFKKVNEEHIKKLIWEGLTEDEILNLFSDIVTKIIMKKGSK